MSGHAEISCGAFIEVDPVPGDPVDHVLACWFPAGHDGLHYDEIDNISWKTGKPDE